MPVSAIHPPSPPASRRRGSTHPQVLGRASDPSLHEADVWWRRTELGVGDQFGFDKVHDSAACFDRASPAGEDVLHPLNVRPIGQEEEVLVATPKDVERRSVGATALASPVRQDCESRKPLRHPSRNGIHVGVDEVPKTPHAGPAMRAVVVAAHLVGRYGNPRVDKTMCTGFFRVNTPR